MDGHDDWITPDDESGEPAMVHTVGMLIEEKPDLIRVIGHQAQDGDRAHRTIIPRGCIVSITYLDPRQ